MKKIFFIAFITCCFSIQSIIAQTLELENRYLDQLEAKGKPRDKELENRRKKVAELFANPGYPTVPYDTITGNFDFRFSVIVPNTSAAELNRKITEWVAATYIRDNTGIKYRDSIDSKMVISGYGDLKITGRFTSSPDETREYRYALSLSVKDNQVAGQFKSVEYIIPRYYGSFENQTVIESAQKLSSLFPVTSVYRRNMEQIVKLIVATAADIKKVELDLKNFLSNDSR